MAAVYRGRGARPGAKRKGVRVQQRGEKRTLRISETYASTYVPGEARSGPVWEAMALGALCVAERPRVLVLGLAGASVVRAILALRPRARFVGVEIDPDVVAAAQRWFDLDSLPLDLEVADAADYLRRSRGSFDLIVEDVFVGRGRSVRKPPWLPQPGLELAKRRLRPSGVLVSNTLDESREVAAFLAGAFSSRLSIEIFGWDNRILLASNAALSGRALRGQARRSEVAAQLVPDLSFRRF